MPTMDMITLTLEVPRDLAVALNVSLPQLPARMRELIAVELFREGRISAGKGAEILGTSKLAFVQLLARYSISYFTESPEELAADVAEVASLLAA